MALDDRTVRDFRERAAVLVSVGHRMGVSIWVGQSGWKMESAHFWGHSSAEPGDQLRAVDQAGRPLRLIVPDGMSSLCSGRTMVRDELVCGPQPLSKIRGPSTTLQPNRS